MPICKLIPHQHVAPSARHGPGVGAVRLGPAVLGHTWAEAVAIVNVAPPLVDRWYVTVVFLLHIL